MILVLFMPEAHKVVLRIDVWMVSQSNLYILLVPGSHQLPQLSGHCSGLRQLQHLGWLSPTWSAPHIRVLCCLIILPILGMQLYLTLTMLLLNTSCSLEPVGKCLSVWFNSVKQG